MQAVRERLTVAVRARSVSNPDHIQIRPASSTVRVVLPPELASARSDNQRSSWEWTYDHVFGGESSQEKIFDETVAPVVDAVLRGYNGTVLCFGQTGSGKTYTHTGSTSQFAQRGVAPRAIARVFSHAASQPQYETLVTASYLEIYNDTLVDLLTELPGPGPESLSLVDCESSTTVRGLRAVAVADEAAALEVLFTGERRRSVSCHQLNDRSSRGHAVFTLSMEFRSRVESSGRVTRAKLVFVDLAGSERLKKTQTSGCLRGESVYINQSLTHLDQVVVAAAVSRGHVPYRRSKLTHLLRDAIGGNSKTLLIANMSGQAAHLEETIATLEFAARARAVVNSASVVEELGPAALLQKYQREVSDLKRELAMRDSLADRPRASHTPLTATQRTEMEERVRAYLEGRGELQAKSVRDFDEMLLAARSLYGASSSRLEELQQKLAADGSADHAPASAEPQVEDRAGVGTDDGKLEAGGGISVGLAQDDAVPAGGIVGVPREAFVAAGEARASLATDSRELQAGWQEEPPAFDSYKEGPGLLVQEALSAAREEVRILKRQHRSLAAAVNEAKAEIDRCREGSKAKAEARTRAGAASISADGTLIIDEEEYALLQRLREAKARYREQYERLTAMATRLKAKADEETALRQEALARYEGWRGTSLTQPPETAPVPVSNGLAAGDEEALFEKLQLERILAEAPDSLAFVRASRAASLSRPATRGGARR